MRKTQDKRNKSYVIIAIVILYAWQFLNFWTHQDLVNHYLEYFQANTELRQETLELRKKVLELRQEVLELRKDILAPIEELYNILIDSEIQ